MVLYFLPAPPSLPRTGPAGIVALANSAGDANQRRQRAEARGNRIDELSAALRGGDLPPQAPLELRGLLERGDTYNASDHSASHAAFKAAHNHVFATLARLCAPNAPQAAAANGASSSASTSVANVFFLEGSDGGSSAALRAAGFASSQLYIANPFTHTCAALRAPPHALVHVATGRAEDVLRDDTLFSTTPFCAYYLDGCGGASAPLIAMIDAIFAAPRLDPHRSLPRLAIGFTLTNACASGSALSVREQEVTRALREKSRGHGFGSMWHVGDEPERYGLDRSAIKQEGGTLTSWLVCERETNKQTPPQLRKPRWLRWGRSDGARARMMDMSGSDHARVWSKHRSR